MLFNLLQEAIPEAAEKLQNPGEAAKELAETIKSTPADQLLTDLAGSAVKFGLKVLAALAIFIVGAWLIKILKKALNKGFTRRNTDRTIVTFVNSLVTISCWVVLLIVAFSTLGVDTTSLAALLAAGGMAIGLALSGTVQNFAGGIMLLIFKPFKAGDYIEAQGFFGQVTEVNISSTKILTTDNREIIIPNGTISNGTINNYSAKEFRRVDISIDLAYENPVDKTKEAILEIVNSCPLVLHSDTPGAWDPFVVVMAMKESTVQYAIRAWVRGAEYMGAFYFINEHLLDELPKKGILFSYPHMDVKVTNLNQLHTENS